MPPRRRRRLVHAAVLVAGVALVVGARHVVFLVVEAQAFTTPPPGALVPDAFGAPSRALAFASGDRVLRASWVPGPDARSPALAIFHGDEEELSRWAAVQAHLRAAGIASFVFDYSGYGASTGRPTLAHLHEDALAAWDRFVAETPHADARIALGFSLGGAVLLDAAERFEPAPRALVLGATFASAREMAVLAGLVPGWAAWLLPDLWNSERLAARITRPLLIVHGRADTLIPDAHAVRLCRAATARRRLVRIEGLTHDAPLDPAQGAAFWDVVIGAVRSGDFGEAATADAACR